MCPPKEEKHSIRRGPGSAFLTAILWVFNAQVCRQRGHGARSQAWCLAFRKRLPVRDVVSPTHTQQNCVEGDWDRCFIMQTLTKVLVLLFWGPELVPLYLHSTYFLKLSNSPGVVQFCSSQNLTFCYRYFSENSPVGHSSLFLALFLEVKARSERTTPAPSS